MKFICKRCGATIYEEEVVWFGSVCRYCREANHSLGRLYRCIVRIVISRQPIQ